MTTVTDSDIKEIKDAIATLGKQIADVEKNLTAKISSVEKNLEVISGEIKTTNAKIDGLDKRLSILETIYQRFFTVMIL